MAELEQTKGDAAAQVRDRTIRLFEFLRELSKLRTKTIRTFDQYEQCIWFDAIPQDIGCARLTWKHDPQDVDAWVEIQKPKLKEYPKPPELLRPWLNIEELADSERDWLVLRDRIVELSESDQYGKRETEVLELSDHPEVQELRDSYVENKWWPWRIEDQRLKPIQRVYTDLFQMYQRQQRLGEEYEVVLGLGCLTWKTPSGQEIRRHLLTAQTDLKFDPVRGRIVLGPAGEGANPRLEQDMLEAQERPEASQQIAIEQNVHYLCTFHAASRSLISLGPLSL